MRIKKLTARVISSGGVSMEQKKKLGYVVTMFPRLSETFILNEILELEKNGFDITIFTRKPSNGYPIHKDFFKVKSSILYLGVMRKSDWFPTLKDNFLLLLLSPRSYLKTFLRVMKKSRRTAWRKFFIGARIARYALSKRISHIHAHFAADNAKIASYASMIFGIGFSFTAHAKDIWVKSTPLSLGKLIEKTRFAVTVCRYNYEYLSGLTTQTQKIHLIYNGLDKEKFKSTHRREDFENGCCELLAVGRLVPKKGFNVLVDACRILSKERISFRCSLIGDGELFSVLRELIQRNNLQKELFLAGACSQEDLITNYLSKADILVVPSIIAPDGDRDGIPTVILEAMAMGVPVISTPVAGIPEIVIDRETGLLVQPGSGEDLARGVVALTGNRELASRLSQKGTARVKDMFDREKNVKMLARLFIGETL